MTPKSLFDNLQRWVKALFTENKISHHPKFTEVTQGKK